MEAYRENTLKCYYYFHDCVWKYIYGNYLGHTLTNTGETMINTHLPKRLKHEAFYLCEKSKEWVSTLAKCDDVIDCLDASDEVMCLPSKNGICLSCYTVT
jgi:hypothetical protein